MKKYEILFPNERIKSRFRKELGKIPLGVRERIKEKVESLSRVPRPQGKIFKYLRPPIQIYDLTAQYRIRIGDYRVLYDVDDTNKKVWILAIRKKGKGTYK
ncbi:MAG: type II toxin-antitoxin system RelE/ParE family toxin [Gemmatimonadota bacterium]|nr:MAG: type II toxin-antitoxin system RelE/ParE family toxin [Gemmatimonadota bacterium]